MIIADSIEEVSEALDETVGMEGTNGSKPGDDPVGLKLKDLLKDGTSKALGMIAIASLNKRNNLFLNILAKGLPNTGLDDYQIKDILGRLSAMDSNNNPDSIGVGEREGRIYSRLVAQRHCGLAHGIGRSGNIAEVQPKAPGSAIIQKLTCKMAKQMTKVAGLKVPKDWKATVLPIATGMALAFSIKAIRHTRPEEHTYVLMTRIDQKSCIKSIEQANCSLRIIPNRVDGEEIATDLKMVEEMVVKLNKRIVAVVATTSCFAPRICDRLVKICQILKPYNIPLVVNNAYGLQSSEAINQLNEAIKSGLIAAIVQSTDKNFMVPVGGSIILAKNDLIKSIENLYPGRANISPLLDLFITFLALGRSGYCRLLAEQKSCFAYFKMRLAELSQSSLPIKLLATPRNDISLAISLEQASIGGRHPLGSYLFLRGVSGARVVPASSKRQVEGHQFVNFGQHHDAYTYETYLTVASAIGQTTSEIDLFIERLCSYFESSPSSPDRIMG